MLRDNRVLFKHSGSFQDLSAALSDIHSQTKVLAFTSGDFLYIASYLPFNHRYVDVAVPNAVVATPTIEFWTGEEWKAVVDVVDETKDSAGASLGQSGIISWQINPRETGWCYDDTDLMEDSGLEDQKLFQLYWCRISWSATLTAETELNYIGHKFSSDPALEAEYPDFASANLKNSWEAGKTDWNEQTLLAGEYIVGDLRGKKRAIADASQIMEWDLFEKASVHRTAMIIYRALGKDYLDELGSATKAYNSAMDLGNYGIDKTRDGSLDSGEKEVRTEWLTR